MRKCVLVAVVTLGTALAGAVATAQQPTEVAFAKPHPHFVAAWAPKEERAAERAAVLAQRTSLELAGATVDQALKALTTQLGLRITYSPVILPKGKHVTIRASDVAVVTALTEILFGSGLDVVVGRDGALAVVSCQHPRAKVGVVVPVQDTGAIVGRVIDKDTGAPLAGATVVIERSDRSATTNGKGAYRIGGVEIGPQRIRARLLGYAPGADSVVVTANAEVTADFALERSSQRLEELVTTTPGGIQSQIRNLSSPITVIDGAEISLQRPHSVSQMFREAVPGAVTLDLPAGQYTSHFSVRGATTLLGGGIGQMKVMIDGIEVAVSTLTAVNPSSVERIEVIRGPQAAAIYGSEAIGGVVQIFTKKGAPDATQPEVSADASVGLIQTPYAGFGEVLRQEYKGSIRGGAPDGTYEIGAAYSRTNAWIPGGEISAQSSPSIYGGAHFTKSLLEVDLSARLAVTNSPPVMNPELYEVGIPFFKSTHLEQQFQNVTWASRVTIRPTRWWHHVFTVGYDRVTQDLTQVQPRLADPGDTLLTVINGGTRKASLAYNTSFESTIAHSISGTLTAGFDHWNRLGTEFSTSGALNTTGSIVTAPGEPVSASRIPTTNSGLFGQLQLGFRDALFVTGGMRAEWNSDFGDSLGTPVSPRLGLAYTHRLGGTSIKLRSAWGRAIRAPSPGLKAAVTSSPIGTVNPNPHLGPERQRGWDAGVDLAMSIGGSVSVTYYDQTADGLIDRVLLGSQPVPMYQYQNVGRVHNTGLEVEAAITVGVLGVKGHYGYTRSRVEQLAPGYTGTVEPGDQVLGTPKHTAGATVTLAPMPTTTISMGAAFVGSREALDYVGYFRCLGGTGSCRNTNFALDRNYYITSPALAKLNVTVAQRLSRHLSGFVTVDNATNNQSHEGSNLSPVMGRITTVGLQLQY